MKSLQPVVKNPEDQLETSDPIFPFSAINNSGLDDATFAFLFIVILCFAFNINHLLSISNVKRLFRSRK